MISLHVPVGKLYRISGWSRIHKVSRELWQYRFARLQHYERPPMNWRTLRIVLTEWKRFDQVVEQGGNIAV